MRPDETTFRLLEWDSSFFDFPVARIEPSLLDSGRLVQILEEMRREGIELAYWFAKDDVVNVAAAEASGGLLADRKTTYSVTFTPSLFVAGNVEESVEFYGSDVPTPELEELAIQSGAMSRFRVDRRVPVGKFDELYRIWIRRIARGELGDGILVARTSSGLIAGMVTLGETNKRADIGLLAVQSWARVATLAGGSFTKRSASLSRAVSCPARLSRRARIGRRVGSMRRAVTVSRKSNSSTTFGFARSTAGRCVGFRLSLNAPFRQVTIRVVGSMVPCRDHRPSRNLKSALLPSGPQCEFWSLALRALSAPRSASCFWPPVTKLSASTISILRTTRG